MIAHFIGMTRSDCIACLAKRIFSADEYHTSFATYINGNGSFLWLISYLCSIRSLSLGIYSFNCQ